MTLLASLSTEYQVPSFKYRVSHTQQSQQVSIRLNAPLVETLSSEVQNQRIGEGHVEKAFIIIISRFVQQRLWQD